MELSTLRLKMRSIIGNPKAIEAYFLGAFETLKDSVKDWISSISIQTSHGIVLSNLCEEVCAWVILEW